MINEALVDANNSTFDVNFDPVDCNIHFTVRQNKIQHLSIQNECILDPN